MRVSGFPFCYCNGKAVLGKTLGNVVPDVTGLRQLLTVHKATQPSEEKRSHP